MSWRRCFPLPPPPPLTGRPPIRARPAPRAGLRADRRRHRRRVCFIIAAAGRGTVRAAFLVLMEYLDLDATGPPPPNSCSSSWIPCMPLVRFLRDSCGVLAGFLRGSCGPLAGRLRPACGPLAGLPPAVPDNSRTISPLLNICMGPGSGQFPDNFQGPARGPELPTKSLQFCSQVGPTTPARTRQGFRKDFARIRQVFSHSRRRPKEHHRFLLVNQSRRQGVWGLAMACVAGSWSGIGRPIDHPGPLGRPPLVPRCILFCPRVELLVVGGATRAQRMGALSLMTAPPHHMPFARWSHRGDIGQHLC